jgi:hypothetical protein
VSDDLTVRAAATARWGLTRLVLDKPVKEGA